MVFASYTIILSRTLLFTSFDADLVVSGDPFLAREDSNTESDPVEEWGGTLGDRGFALLDFNESIVFKWKIMIKTN